MLLAPWLILSLNELLYNAPSKLTIKMRHKIQIKGAHWKFETPPKFLSESMITDQTYLFLNRVQDRRSFDSSESPELSISLLCCYLKLGCWFCRFDEESLRILELSLVAMNAKSFYEVRSRLRDFLRSESVAIFGELSGESMVAKLTVLEFFARAFALIGDMEVRIISL